MKSERKDLTISDLQESKIYVRNNISYMNPKEIINPFIERIGLSENDNVHIQTQNEVVNQNDDGVDNIAYPRFLVEIRKQEIVFGDVLYQNVFGMLIGMDQQKPSIKVYTGMNVSACTNLCVFNADEVHSQNLLETLDNTWNTVERFARNEERKLEDYANVHNKMANDVLSSGQINKRLGFLLRHSHATKLGTTPIVAAAKSMGDKLSPYYFEGETTLFNLFNAITQNITDSKDLLWKPDKTLGLAKLLIGESRGE